MSQKSLFRKNDKIVTLNFHAKNCQIEHFLIIVDYVPIQNYDFWREIQILQINLALKKSQNFRS